MNQIYEMPQMFLTQKKLIMLGYLPRVSWMQFIILAKDMM
jgi:hypothetical protein